MRCKIYTAAAGGEIPGEAGWCFIVTEQVQLTGSAIIHYSGCTKANLRTVLAMATLQALYWLKDTGIKEYVIHQPCYPDFVFNSSLSKYLNDFPRTNIVKREGSNVFSELAESLASKSMISVLVNRDVTYDKMEVADPVIKKESLFSQRYVVLLKTDASNLIALKNLSTAAKKIEVWTEEDFNKGGFIKL